MKTQYIEFVFTGPPQADLGQFVQVIDDRGEPVSIGGWYHDGQHWRYQIPVELVPRLIVPGRYEPTDPAICPCGNAEHTLEAKAASVANDALAMRRKLKERVLAQKQAAAPVVGDDWQLCPECHERFDPRKDDLVDCPNCSEPRCTAKCLPDPAGPCLTCQALEAGPEEGGYDPRAKPGTSRASTDDDDADDDDDDEES